MARARRDARALGRRRHRHPREQRRTNLRKPSAEYTEAEYDALQATNLGSAFHLSARCLAALKRRRRVRDQHELGLGLDDRLDGRAVPHAQGRARHDDALPRVRVGRARRARQRGGAVVHQHAAHRAAPRRRALLRRGADARRRCGEWASRTRSPPPSPFWRCRAPPATSPARCSASTAACRSSGFDIFAVAFLWGDSFGREL